MLALRTTPAAGRSWCAVAFALLLLAVRVLAPVGFMPAFEHGLVTIVSCPDADAPVVSMMGHHHHHHHHHQHSGDHRLAHQPCPYAAAGALGALGNDGMAVLAMLFFAAALLIGRAFLFVERQGRRDRPPAIGPPIPA